MHSARGVASENVYSKPIFGYLLHENFRTTSCNVTCNNHPTLFLHDDVAWLRCYKGIHTRGAIESLFATWTDCSEDFCQAVANSGVLTATANSLHWALDHEALHAVRVNILLHIASYHSCKFSGQTTESTSQGAWIEF